MRPQGRLDEGGDTMEIITSIHEYLINPMIEATGGEFSGKEMFCRILLFLFLIFIIVIV